jgi:NAD(P)-dependent dehydrogenase (short-subunit alcohol dehydrogenase family)
MSAVRLQDRVAIVTGGATGIGRACCLALAAEGADVVVVDVQAEAAGEVETEVLALGRAGLVQLCDVSDPDQVAAMVRAVIERFGRVDVLVNGAIRRAGGPLESLSLQSWDSLINIGLRGYFIVGQAVGREMIARGSGVIINLASTGGHTPYPGAGAYSSCKAAVIMLAKCFAVEWAQYGVRACSISPGMIRTPMTDHIYQDPEQLRGRSAAAPLGRIGTAEEIARVAVFLASDDASYITGEDVLVDGGFVYSKFTHVPGRHQDTTKERGETH